MSPLTRLVSLEPDAVGALADDLVHTGALTIGVTDRDPWSIAVDDPERACALVLTLATINFGSGWHPVVAKRPGMSGATSMAAAIRDWEREAPITVDRLRSLDLAETRRLFGQPSDRADVSELMALFTAALVDLGQFVGSRHTGSFVELVASCRGSAVALQRTLTEMPAFDDRATWTTPDGATIELAFDKRAQLAAADLHRAFGGTDIGRFDDLHRLTAFADNLVPHVLYVDGILRFDPSLRADIDAGRLLEPGSPEEVEIRALGVHGVELLGSALADRGHTIPSWQLDGVLWRRGGGARYKAVPRHRARSRYY